MAMFSIAEQKKKIFSFFGLNDESKVAEDDYSQEQQVNERVQASTSGPAVSYQNNYQRSEPAFQRKPQAVPANNYQAVSQGASQTSTARESAPYAAVEKQPRFAPKENVVPMKNPTKGAGNTAMSAQITIVEPKVYSEALGIAKKIVANEAVIVNFTLIEEAQARRIVDFLTGTVYALGGDIQRIGSEIFLCTPINITIDGATAKSLLAADDLVDY